MGRLAFLTAALIVTAGAAQAQSSGYTPIPNSATPNQAPHGDPMGGCGHMATIKDEYRFRYDNEGNRLNTRGCIIAPPVTPPGAAALTR